MVEEFGSDYSILTEPKAEGDLPKNESSERDKVIQSVMKFVFKLMDADKKVGPLKALQGHIWLAGYQNGLLKGEYDFI
jgi:methionine salvage enolase-phosphatase E1